MLSRNSTVKQEIPQWDICSQTIFFLSHSQFGKYHLLEQQVSLTWSSSRGNRLHSCLAQTNPFYTCAHELEKRKRKRHLMKDRKQLFFTPVLLDSFVSEVLLLCPLYVQVDQTKAYWGISGKLKLLERNAPSPVAQCSSLNLSLGAPKHWAGRNSLTLALTYLNKIY